MDIGAFVAGLDIPKMSLLDVATMIASGAMVFGGVVPYIPQYRTIRRTLSCDGFSPLVCFVLLLANILRVFFWFGKRFETPLLAQSLLMIMAMLAMVEICVRVRNQSEIIQSKQHSLRAGSPSSTGSPARPLAVPPVRRTFYQCLVDMDWRYFWKWTDFLSYVEFVLSITALLSLTTYLLIDNSVYVETIGFLAVFIEALLGTPQLYRNYINKSTEGMSVTMVGMWFCGDTFKTGYFILRSNPMQFWICGTLQILVDISILCQVFYYLMYPNRASLVKHSR